MMLVTKSAKELPFRIPPKPRPAAFRDAGDPEPPSRPRPGQSEPMGDEVEEEEEARPSTDD